MSTIEGLTYMTTSKFGTLVNQKYKHTKKHMVAKVLTLNSLISSNLNNDKQRTDLKSVYDL